MIIGIKKVGEDLMFKEVDKLSLEDMQELVGGYVECVNIDIGSPVMSVPVDIWLNEEGKLHGLKPNFGLFTEDGVQDVILGDVFFALSNDDGETIGLDDTTGVVLSIAMDFMPTLCKSEDEDIEPYVVPLLPCMV